MGIWPPTLLKKCSEITGTKERERETKPLLCSPQPVHGRRVQGLKTRRGWGKLGGGGGGALRGFLTEEP